MVVRNLPVAPTTFIGRDAEINDITNLIASPDCRLITLVGPGGIGKTRLAIESASKISDEIFPNGIHFVDLTPVQIVDNVVPTIATAVGYQFPQSENTRGSGNVASNEDHLIDFFSQKNMLLLVDNAEHLPDSVFLIERILSEAPDVKFLVTSRVPFNSQWENLYDVQGLPVDTGAVDLFTDRAVRVQPRFDLQNEASCVTSICQLMEGMPLGLELAATWLRVLSCQELTEELSRNLSFLESRQRTVDQRHASLQAVFEQSWQLLTDNERNALMRLSVFKGTFTRDAARRVAGAGLGTLTALVDQSLVQVTPEGRYRLHELVRQLGAEKLADDLDAEVETLNAHADYYSHFIEQQLHRLKSDQMPEALQAIEADIDNVRAAWNHAIAVHDSAPIQRMAESLHHYFVLCMYHSEGVDMYQVAIDAFSGEDIICYLKIYQSKLYEIAQLYDKRDEVVSDVFDHIRTMDDLALKAATFERMGHGTRMAGGNILQGICYLEQALSLFEVLGDPHDIANVLRSLAYAYANSDDEKTLSYLRSSLEMALKSGNQWQLAHTLVFLGYRHRIAGHVDAALTYFQQGKDYASQFDHHGFMVDCLCGMSIIQLLNRGSFVEASHLGQEALSLARNSGDKGRLVVALNTLGTIAFTERKLDQCEIYWSESRDLALHLESPWLLTAAHSQLGMLEILKGNFDVGAQYREEAISVVTQVGDKVTVAGTYMRISYAAYCAGRYVEGKHYAKESLAVWRTLTEVQRPLLLGGAHTNLAHNILELGERRDALQNYNRAFSLSENKLPNLMLETMAGIAKSIAYGGDLLTAVKLLHHILDDNRLGEHRSIAQRGYDDLIAELPADVVEELLAEADELTHEEAVDIMLNHPIWREHCLDQPLIDPLSERELEVLGLVAKGKSNRQIAEELFLAAGTVKTHIHNIMGKLDAQNRTEAVAKAQELGIL